MNWKTALFVALVLVGGGVLCLKWWAESQAHQKVLSLQRFVVSQNLNVRLADAERDLKSAADAGLCEAEGSTTKIRIPFSGAANMTSLLAFSGMLNRKLPTAHVWVEDVPSWIWSAAQCPSFALSEVPACFFDARGFAEALAEGNLTEKSDFLNLAERWDGGAALDWSKELARRVRLPEFQSEVQRFMRSAI